MTAPLSSVHVLAAVLAVGPVAVAASMFPPAVRAQAVGQGGAAAPGVAAALHRVCRTYAAAGGALSPGPPIQDCLTAAVLDACCRS